MRLCSIPDCGRKHLAKGFCRAHYLRQYKGQDLGGSWIARTPLTKETLPKRCVVDEKGCWNWQGSRISSGYGNAEVEDHWVLVHRLSYELHVGPIPDGLVIDHLCCNRLCCNPDHLEAITHAENTRRALRKTACKRGHDLTDTANIYTRPDNGGRQCIACIRIRSRARSQLSST